MFAKYKREKVEIRHVPSCFDKSQLRSLTPTRLDGTIIGKRCPVFDYTEKRIVTIDAYKKEMRNKFSRIRRLTSSSSPWVEKIKTDKIWLCESVGKLKGIGKKG